MRSMAPKRPERTARRARERAARQLVRDREKLWELSAGGSAARPITVDSPAVIDVRVRTLACPQCEGELAIEDHRSPRAGERVLTVRCKLCHVARALYFRLGSSAPS